MTDLPVNLPDWGPWTIIAFIVILILTGRLVPRRLLEDEKERTAKAEASAERTVTLVEKVSGQVAKLTEATERNAQTDDLAVVMLRGIRRKLGIQEGE